MSSPPPPVTPRELILWCDCGWTKAGTFVTWSWLRLVAHRFCHHRHDANPG